MTETEAIEEVNKKGFTAKFENGILKVNSTGNQNLTGELLTKLTKQWTVIMNGKFTFHKQ